MFERYTERARRAIFFARYEASQFGAEAIETEHLLLGLLREDKAVREIIGESRLELIRSRVEDECRHRPNRTPASVDMPLSHECKRVVAYSAEESERLGDRSIRAVHLLLGLLRERECVAAKILGELALHAENVREAIAKRGPETLDRLEPDGGRMRLPAAHTVLLYLLEDERSAVAGFLREHGITVESVRKPFGG